MTRPKLTYFDAPVSRGEECRLALHVAGVDFEDVRLSREQWLALKPTTPYGAVPIYEEAGRPVLAQSTAIMVLIGRRHGLHPSDDFEAARHEALMQYVEDLRATVGPTLRLPDDQKQAAREPLVTGYLPTWGANVDKQLGDGPFVAGAKLQVVDLKLHMAVRWFSGGKVDHIPATIFGGSPKLMRLLEAVRDHAAVKSWYARSS